MGYLHYGSTQIFAFTDRTLTHLRTVIVGKLSLQENFIFTWIDGDCQRSIWCSPQIPLHFEFEAPETPPLNREWINELIATANEPAGLRLVPEPKQ